MGCAAGMTSVEHGLGLFFPPKIAVWPSCGP